jgi:hypothetical protein
VASLVATAKLNEVKPLAWFIDVLGRGADKSRCGTDLAYAERDVAASAPGETAVPDRPIRSILRASIGPALVSAGPEETVRAAERMLRWTRVPGPGFSGSPKPEFALMDAFRLTGDRRQSRVPGGSRAYLGNVGS